MFPCGSVRLFSREQGADIFLLETDGLSSDERRAWLARAGEVLDEGERARFERYIPEAKKLEFLLGRALIRAVLEPRGISGARLTSRGEHEKPFLEGREHEGPRLNLTHSHGAIALILHPSQEVSVDVERLRPFEASLVAYTMRDEERAAAGASEEAFYAHWTAKEAFMKLHGEGLRLPPRRLRVDLARRTVTDVDAAVARRFGSCRSGEFVVAWMVEDRTLTSEVG